jgi:hypothetical protein
MKRIAFLLGIILILASSAPAQVKLASLPAAGPLAPTLAVAAPPAHALFAYSPAEGAAIDGPGPSAFASSAPAEPPQGVYGVFQSFEWQAYAGYTFFRFYEVPNITQNMSGFNLSMAYYPRGGWIAADGELVAAFGSQAGVTSKFALGMGGVRFRWSAPRAVELWVHGLAGGSHFVPQTPYGGQSAFAYEAGGGIDIDAHHHRMAYRVQGDMVGTRYFGTYQYSPRISAGIVYKF